MPYKSRKIIVMCCEGRYQDHLILRLNQAFTICGIIRYRGESENNQLINRIRRHKQPLNALSHLLTRIKLRKYEKNAKSLIDKLFNHEREIDSLNDTIPTLYCSDINQTEVVHFIKQQDPDLICVNGTNLLRQPVLEIIDTIKYGIINLHTGLSPYSRGGNCNLFMLLEGQPQLVGITVHHIDPGIDSGDIIISTRPQMLADDSFEEIDAKCFYVGNEAMIQACMQLFAGTSVRIKQWQQGKLFLNRTGYSYNPAKRLEVNQLIEKGLLKDYLEHRQTADEPVRTIGEFDYPTIDSSNETL